MLARWWGWSRLIQRGLVWGGLGMWLAGFVIVAGVAAAELDYPLAVAVAEDGTIYLADRYLPGIWKVQDGKVELYFQASKKFRTPLNAVRCLAIDKDGKLLAGDSSTRDVYRFNEKREPVPLTKMVNAGIGIPMAIAVDKAGDLWVCDLEIHRVVKVPAAGGEAKIVAEVQAPRGIAIDSDDRAWVVAYAGKDQIVRVSPDGKIESVIKGRPFNFPHQIVLDQDRNAYVTDGYEKAVWKIDSSGTPVKLASGKPFDNPVGIAIRGASLFVIDPRAKGLFEVATKDGAVTPIKLEMKP